MIGFGFTRAASLGAAALFLGSVALADTAADTASAASPTDAAATADGTAASATQDLIPTIVVTAQHLDEVRSHIQTQTGASTYTIDAKAIEATPGGDNTLLNQVVLQAPDVAQDSFGQYHVRGEHDGLQYRINGVILPEGISVYPADASSAPRLPLLGLRALMRNGLKLTVGSMAISLRQDL